MQSPLPFKNRILAALPPETVQRLNLKKVRLGADDTLYAQGDVLTHLLFPEHGVVGTTFPFGSADVLVSGFESVVGLRALNANVSSAETATVRLAGWGYQMTAERARQCFQSDSAFHDKLLVAVQEQLLQAGRMATCGLHHDGMQRLAKMLALYHWRMGEGTFEITQACLAGLLALRRTTISIQMKDLKRKGAIHHTRGKMSVFDIQALEAAACHCLLTDACRPAGSL